MRSHIGFAAIAATVAMLSLTACGNTTQDRALSGGAIGAGGGALAGAALGSPGAGALLGGAAGAAAGGLTSQRDVDLGRPVWQR
ncbi:MAG TPA: hypothetical protein VGD08_18380 [Stellaceae bacterium]